RHPRPTRGPRRPHHWRSLRAGQQGTISPGSLLDATWPARDACVLANVMDMRRSADAVATSDFRTRTSVRPTHPATALLYRRMSSEEQAPEGLSREAQLATLRRSAATKEWIIGGEWQDVLSGNRADRPGYLSMLEEARRLRATGHEVVVVVKWLDRFGRSMLE